MAMPTELTTYLEREYNDHIEPFREIAENNMIQSSCEAFHFDHIKKDIAEGKCKSADALYINKHISFIEFKTGFSSEKEDCNTNTHIENLKLNIRLKALETLVLFEKAILPASAAIIPEGSLKKYIAVVDSSENGRPVEALADALSEESDQEVPFRDKTLKDSLRNYGRQIKNGQKIFYDEVDVWYDYEFDRKIANWK